MNDLLDHYLAGPWNETDPDARRSLIAQHWSPQPSYTDPLAAVTGRDAVDATIGAVQQQFPGFVFSPGRTGRRPPPAGSLHVGSRPRRHRTADRRLRRGRPR